MRIDSRPLPGLSSIRSARAEIPLSEREKSDLIRDHRKRLPDELATAARDRKVEFLVGRLCAREAVRALGIDCDWIEREGRLPQWPEAAVGSITHKGRQVWAVAALARDHFALGIDREVAFPTAESARIARRILLPEEMSLKAPLALLFAAKEAVFKASYPRSRIFLEFSDVEIRPVTENGRFDFRVGGRDYAGAGYFWEIDGSFETLVTLSESNFLPKSP